MRTLRRPMVLWVAVLFVIFSSTFQPNLIRQAVTTDWTFLPSLTIGTGECIANVAGPVFDQSCDW